MPLLLPYFLIYIRIPKKGSSSPLPCCSLDSRVGPRRSLPETPPPPTTTICATNTTTLESRAEQLALSSERASTRVRAPREENSTPGLRKVRGALPLFSEKASEREREREISFEASPRPFLSLLPHSPTSHAYIYICMYARADRYFGAKQDIAGRVAMIYNALKCRKTEGRYIRRPSCALSCVYMGY